MLKFLRDNKLIACIFFISILFTYSYIDFRSNMSVGTGHAFWAKSIILSPNFNINDYWGNSGEDWMIYEGDYYLPYAPLNAVIMAVPYLGLMSIYFFFVHLGGTINGDLSVLLESLVLSLPSSLALAGILFLLKLRIKSLNLGSFQNMIIMASIAMGTLLFIYSLSFFNHIIAAFFIFTAYYILTGTVKKKYFISGIFVGLAFLTEFPTVLFCFVLLAAELLRLFKKKIIFKDFLRNMMEFSIPMLVAVLLIFLYNYIHFDHPFKFGEQVFKEYRLANDKTTYGFTQNPILGLYGSLFSPLKGLFVYSPFLIFGLFGLKSLFRSSKYNFVLLVGYIALITFIYSFWDDCYGASSFGDRYLVTTIPFWGILLAHGLKTIYRFSILKYLFFAIVVISISLNATSSLFGIAQGKMSECELYLNTYDPYTKVLENLNSTETRQRMAPAVLKYIRNSLSD